MEKRLWQTDRQTIKQPEAAAAMDERILGILLKPAMMESPSRYFLRSSRIRVDLLSYYETKPTDKREQYNRMAEKN